MLFHGKMNLFIGNHKNDLTIEGCLLEMAIKNKVFTADFNSFSSNFESGTIFILKLPLQTGDLPLSDLNAVRIK